MPGPPPPYDGPESALPQSAAPVPHSARFRPRHRLTHAREFDAVYDAKVRKSRGPLVVFTRPNGLAHHRLGLAVSARLGGAVLRNRLKRLIREAFRIDQHGWRDAEPEPLCLDIIVSVRAPRPLPLESYRRLLAELIADSLTEWRRRARRPPTPTPTPTPAPAPDPSPRP